MSYCGNVLAKQVPIVYFPLSTIDDDEYIFTDEKWLFKVAIYHSAFEIILVD